MERILMGSRLQIFRISDFHASAKNVKITNDKRNDLQLHSYIQSRRKGQQVSLSSGLTVYFSQGVSYNTLDKWAKVLDRAGGTVAHADASIREQYVVAQVKAGTWDVHSYHEYQRLVAGSGNVDSAALLLDYGVRMSLYEATLSADDIINKLFSAILHCDIISFQKLVEEEVDGDTISMAISSDGTTLLIAAAYTGCEEIVRMLLKVDNTQDVDRTAANGMTALMTAASRGYHHIVEILLHDSHADVNYPHKFAGTTALHMAAELNHVAVISILCRYNANPRLLTSTGCTPLHVHASVGKKKSIPVDHDSIDDITTYNIVRALVECGADIMALLNNDTTPLYLAAQNGHADTVEALILHGADATFAMPITSYKGRYDMMSKQQTSSFDDNHLMFYDTMINSEAGNGAEAIHAAAEEGRLDVIHVLIKYSIQSHQPDDHRNDIINRVDLNTRSMGVSPLHSASQYNHPHIVEALLQAGADVDIISYTDGATPLYYAVGHAHHDVIDVLIRCNASLTKRQRSGGFPLLYAVLKGHEAVVRQLVDAGALVDDMTSDGLSIIHMAAMNGNTNTIKYLFHHHDKNSRVSLCHIAPDGDTILHAAARGGHAKVIYMIFNHIVKQPSSYESRCDVNSLLHMPSKKDASLALHIAAMQGSAPSIRSLIHAGARCDIPWQASELESVYPLILSIRSGDINSTDALLSSDKCDIEGHNIIAISRGGVLVPTTITALLIAIDRGEHDIVNLLMRHGVDVNHGIKGGGVLESPLLLAVIRGHAKLVSTLLAADASCNIMVASSSSGKQESLIDISRRKRDYDVMKVLSMYDRCLIRNDEL